MIENIDVKFGSPKPIFINHPTDGRLEYRFFGKFSYRGVPGVPEELVKQYVVSFTENFVLNLMNKYSPTIAPMYLNDETPNLIVKINSEISDLGAEIISLNIENISRI